MERKLEHPKEIRVGLRPCALGVVAEKFHTQRQRQNGERNQELQQSVEPLRQAGGGESGVIPGARLHGQRGHIDVADHELRHQLPGAHSVASILKLERCVLACQFRGDQSTSGNTFIAGNHGYGGIQGLSPVAA